MQNTKFHRLCKALDYRFQNLAYLQQALTHCSAGDVNNERLEFLGDSILSFVMAEALYQRFPKEPEGQLSRLRAYLVKGETLAQIAQELELGAYLALGQGELKSGGFRRTSILADALEAVFAAIYLDGGLDACQAVILHLYRSRLNNPDLRDHIKDAKTELQEYLQAKKHALPKYTLIRTEGQEHQQTFHVTCSIPALNKHAEGQGNSRRQAEQQAAKQLLNALIHDDGL